jgi:hypothetical protein
MAISVKISQLLPGGAIQSQDEIPIARGGLETFKIGANQIVTNGINVGLGPGQIFLGRNIVDSTSLQFRTLSGTDTINVSNQGNTVVISAPGQSPTKTSITGNGTTSTFPIIGANSINPNNYRVDIDGVLQEPSTNYNIVGTNIIFTTPPPAGGKVTVIANNLVTINETVPSDGSVTPQKLSTGAPTWNIVGNVGIGTSTPNSAAALDVTSNNRGFLPPRMNTAARNAITSPPGGLIIFNTQTSKLNFFNGSFWEQIG